MDNWEEYLESQRQTKAAEQPQTSEEQKNYRSSEYSAATYATMTGVEKKKHQTQMVRVCPKCGTEYSYKTKTCVSCYEKLPEPVSSDQAEDIARDIRLTNGSEESGLTTSKLKTMKRAGLLLSLLAIAASGTMTALYYFNIANPSAGDILIKSNQNFSFSFLWLINGILLINIFCSIFPEAAVALLRIIPFFRRPIRLLRLMFNNDFFDKDQTLAFVCRSIITVPIMCIIVTGFIFFYFINNLLFTL